MPALERKQFDHICNMLKAHGIPVTKENIVRYLKQNKNQFNKLIDNVKRNQEIFDLNLAAYMADVKFRFKLFGYWIVFYKWGVNRPFMEIIKSGDKNGIDKNEC